MYSCAKYAVAAFVVLLMLSVLSYWKIVVLNERSAYIEHPVIGHPYEKQYQHDDRHEVARNEIEAKTVRNEIEVEKLRNWQVEIEKRVERVKRLCKKHHLGIYSWKNFTNDLNVKDPPTPQYSYFFHNPDHNLAWCPVYKAGSTTWLYNMMILAGFTEEQLKNPKKQLSILAREVYSDMNPSVLKEHVMKLLVVRHPFERLLSAYRDKLSNASVGLEHGTAHFYEKYGKSIVKKFRTDSTITQKEPTFEEFVRYLIKTDVILYADDHWLPAYYSCTPCRVEYDVIAKTETYMMDQKYIIEKASLDTNGGIKPRWQHRTATNNLTELQTSVLARKYFQQLHRSQIKSLYEKYFLDFELFNYSPTTYINYGIDDVQQEQLT